MVLPESDQIHLLITLKNSEQMNEHFQHENSEKKIKAQDCGSVLQLGEVKCWERDLTIFTFLTVLPPGQGQFMELYTGSVQFSSVAQLCLTLCDPMNQSMQASLSITNSRSLLKLMPIKLVMPSSHLILCRHLLLLPPIPPSIRVFSNESTLHMRWPKY